MAKSTKKQLSNPQRDALLLTLKTRFEKNMNRHQGLAWNEVEKKLKGNSNALWSLYQMENTGGEPDVVAYDKKNNTFSFYDCSPESPSGRRSICYDKQGLDSRKEFKPAHNAMDMASEIGIEILNEEEYRYLLSLGKFDTKTSSWILTPADIRKLGGALFGDYRYGKVFIYHNSAPSYYAARGFRGSLKI